MRRDADSAEGAEARLEEARRSRLADLLTAEIDRLRAELHRAYLHRGCVDDQLLDISRKLDRVIMLYERTVRLESTASDVRSVGS
jgi:hypothetical protein